MERRCKRLVCILLSFLVIAGVFTFSGGKNRALECLSKVYTQWDTGCKRHLRGVWISTVANLDWPSV